MFKKGNDVISLGGNFLKHYPYKPFQLSCTEQKMHEYKRHCKKLTVDVYSLFEKQKEVNSPAAYLFHTYNLGYK
jgi:hypothetical protein